MHVCPNAGVLTHTEAKVRPVLSTHLQRLKRKTYTAALEISAPSISLLLEGALLSSPWMTVGPASCNSSTLSRFSCLAEALLYEAK